MTVGKADLTNGYQNPKKKTLGNRAFFRASDLARKCHTLQNAQLPTFFF